MTYLALLGHPPARRLLLALAAAWLSFGMVFLAIYLEVHRATGSLRLPGLAVAAFAVGSGTLAPLRGRAIDRRGAGRTLPCFAAGYAAALALLAVAAERGAPAWTLVAAAAAAGASAPPLVASARAAWARAVEPELLRRAYALTALLGDVGFVVAPPLAALVYLAAPPAPLLVCGALALLAAGIAARGAPGATPTAHRRSPLGSPSLRRLLAVSIALGAALGLAETAVPTLAARWDVPGAAGPLLGAFAAGSVAGSLWFGRRHWRADPERRYLGCALLLAASLTLPALLASGPLALAPLLALTGALTGPATISLFEALDHAAPDGGTEALTWVTTAEAAGLAAGAALAGVLAPWPWAPFALGAVTLAAAAGGALARTRQAVANQPLASSGVPLESRGP